MLVLHGNQCKDDLFKIATETIEEMTWGRHLVALPHALSPPRGGIIWGGRALSGFGGRLIRLCMLLKRGGRGLGRGHLFQAAVGEVL